MRLRVPAMESLTAAEFHACMTEHTQMTLVLGSTGKTGRRVAARLAERGVPMRLGSRSETPPFDWDDPATWKPVLQGIDIAYISYFPDLAVSAWSSRRPTRASASR
jgi:nucleoside-diphosphate-sugar epimerase